MGSKTAEAERHVFQAETQQLLHIVIHSLYTDKEIFLRELISNASDALDRLRFEALQNEDLLEEDEKLEIHIETDKDAKTLTVRDNGIGMSRQEVIDNLGTIAKSGTRELLRELKDAKGREWADRLIGQFGVGFYSAFMVADQVEVLTRRAGESAATLWKSGGDGSFTVEGAEKEDRGTTILLHLKEVEEDSQDYTDPWVIERLVKRHSDFVSYPIVQHKSVAPAADGEKESDGDSAKTEEKTLNSMTPLWTRPPEELQDSDYNEFYKHIAHDWEDPLERLSFKAEGRTEYQALVFIPSRAPLDLFHQGAEYGLRLYAKRVLIMERCRELVPQYLRFLKGVVDSSDLPLNISRQRLQEDRHINQIRKWITKRILDALATMQSDEPEKYRKFWDQFGTTLKEGTATDWDNREKLIPLLLFESSLEAEKRTTLAEYKERMKEGQKAIYYMSGESRSLIESSPHLESFRDRGFEVIYLTEPVDEIMIQSVSDFDDVPLKSAGKGEIEAGQESEEVKKDREKQKDVFRPLTDFLAKRLEEGVREVRLSTRLTTSPACLVSDESDLSPHLERILERANMGGTRQKRILELNPEHLIVQGMRKRYEKDPDDTALPDFAELLYGYGLLAEGSTLTDPGRFNQLLAKLMEERIAVSEG